MKAKTYILQAELAGNLPAGPKYHNKAVKD